MPANSPWGSFALLCSSKTLLNGTVTFTAPGPGSPGLPGVSYSPTSGANAVVTAPTWTPSTKAIGFSVTIDSVTYVFAGQYGNAVANGYTGTVSWPHTDQEDGAWSATAN